MIPPGARLFVGLISVVIYGLVGASMLGGSWHWVGVVLIGLAVFRAVVWVRQLWWRFTPDEDEDD